MSMCDFFYPILIYFLFKEDYDKYLWSRLSSAVLGSDSVVYEECTINGVTLPHGDIDIVAGRIGEKDGLDIGSSFGVTVGIDDVEMEVNDSVGVSTKTRTTLATTPVSKFIWK